MNKPNFILIMCDQFRGDCLGIENHPDLGTPNLDMIGALGAHLRQAYCPSPICAAARHSLMTGMTCASNGQLDNAPARVLYPEATLPNLFRLNGYNTYSVGRSMHLFPNKARYGFETVVRSPMHDCNSIHRHKIVPRSDYFRNSFPHNLDHSLPEDGFTARPWPYDDSLHPTNFSVNAALNYLDNRDPEESFFLHVGFTAPHPPFIPPEFFYYHNYHKDLRPPFIGDWVGRWPDGTKYGTFTPWAKLPEHMRKSNMAGYYGSIEHVDNQLYNFICRLKRESLLDNTYLLFTSDHGEMLGDHNLYRKGAPYQGSVRVPFLIQGPGIPQGQVIDAPVSLIDILPTLCSLAGIDIPDHVEGKDISPLILKDAEPVNREFVHGEYPHNTAYENASGFHYITDGKLKYIWFSQDGKELLFDLINDPNELHDLSDNPEYTKELAKWQSNLAQYLKDRPEGFSDGKNLFAGKEHNGLLPHAKPL